MGYFLDLFSPETYEAFRRSNQSVSGFRSRHKNAAERIRPGDKLVCYMTKLSRWFGLLEVLEGPFQDDKPIFYPAGDPFVIRFRVRPLVWLPVDRAVPIYEDALWNRLSFTRGQTRGTPTWTGRVRTSLVELTEDDGRLLESVLLEQSRGGKTYPVDPADFHKLATHTVRRVDKDVTVAVPEDRDQEVSAGRPAQAEVRESIQIQQRDVNGESMRKVHSRHEPEEMLPEYDFSAGVHGKYGSRFAKDTIMVVLDPDVAEVFPDPNSVNKALRALGHIIRDRAPKAGRHRSAG